MLKKNIPHICNGSGVIPRERFLEMQNIMSYLDAFAKCEEKQGSGEEDAAEMDMEALEEKIVKR